MAMDSFLETGHLGEAKLNLNTTSTLKLKRTRMYSSLVSSLLRLCPEDQLTLASVSAINWKIEAIRHGGTLGLAGVYGAKANGFLIGDILAKGVTIKCGQALVQILIL
jgi:threonine dehydrogenase-like Zn-dependent dehydrogenase